MLNERTLSIIKPDAVGRNLIGRINARLEAGGLSIVAARMLRLTSSQARDFYAEHRERTFFPKLIKFMTSGPVLAQVLEGKDAIARNRQIMGSTDPAKADPGTIRADFGESIEANSVHGSDSPESAKREIAHFFSATDIPQRD